MAKEPSAVQDLIAAQGACDPVFKDATNPHFRSRYASLSACVDACKEAFHRHNFAILQSNGYDQFGPYVLTTLLHSSGEKYESIVYLVLSKQDMQGLVVRLHTRVGMDFWVWQGLPQKMMMATQPHRHRHLRSLQYRR